MISNDEQQQQQHWKERLNKVNNDELKIRERRRTRRRTNGDDIGKKHTHTQHNTTHRGRDWGGEGRGGGGFSHTGKSLILSLPPPPVCGILGSF